MRSSGSRGVTSGTASFGREPAQVSNLSETVLGGQGKNTDNVLQHMAVVNREGYERDVSLIARSTEQLVQRGDARTDPSLLDTGDFRLGRSGPPSQCALAQPGT